MTRTHDPIRAPWAKGDSLSCTVFDARREVVATIFARTAEEQAKRLHLVKAAPALAETLRELVTAARAITLGEEDAPLKEQLAFVMLLHRAEDLLKEAEPV